MNDESVIKVLQESREVMTRCLLLLDSAPGYSPIVNVQKDRLKLLRIEIDDAIIYLGKNRSVVCDACSCDVTPENCGEAYCNTCIRDSENYDEYQ